MNKLESTLLLGSIGVFGILAILTLVTGSDPILSNMISSNPSSIDSKSLSKNITPSIQTIPHIQTESKLHTSDSCKGEGGCYKGIVTVIVYPDTLMIGDTMVRLTLINIDNEHYTEAMDLVNSICPIGSQALIDEDDERQDRHGQLVAKVSCGDKVLNSELLDSGYARKDPLPSEFKDEL